MKRGFLARVCERTENGSSWGEDEDIFDTREDARIFIRDYMIDIIGFRIESGETAVEETDGYAKYMIKDDESGSVDLSPDVTFEQLVEFLAELDMLDGENYSFYWSIEDS